MKYYIEYRYLNARGAMSWMREWQRLASYKTERDREKALECLPKRRSYFEVKFGAEYRKEESKDGTS